MSVKIGFPWINHDMDPLNEPKNHTDCINQPTTAFTQRKLSMATEKDVIGFQSNILTNLIVGGVQPH